MADIVQRCLEFGHLLSTFKLDNEYDGKKAEIDEAILYSILKAKQASDETEQSLSKKF